MDSYQDSPEGVASVMAEVLGRLRWLSFSVLAVSGILAFLFVVIGWFMFQGARTGEQSLLGRVLGVGLVAIALGVWLVLCWVYARFLISNLEWSLRRGARNLVSGNEGVHPAALAKLSQLLEREEESALRQRMGWLGRSLLHELNNERDALGTEINSLLTGTEKDPARVAASYNRLKVHFEALRVWLDGETGSPTVETLPTVCLTTVAQRVVDNSGNCVVLVLPTVAAETDVFALEELLEGVLFNLVRNAETHNPVETENIPLRVLVTVWTTTQLPKIFARGATASRQAANGWVIATVWDTGPWIDPDRFPSLFAFANRIGGHGFGLSFSRAVMKSFGGDLGYWDRSIGPWDAEIAPCDRSERRAYPRKRLGKVFWCYLPAARDSNSSTSGSETKR